MGRIIAFFVLLGYFRPANAQYISIFVKSPKAYALSDSILSLQVFVGSTNPISSVTANVLGRQIVLNLDNVGSPPSYIGNISLGGLPEDTLYVEVVATDNQNNQSTVSQPFIYDRAPVLIVDSPSSWSVASPLLHIKARCVDSPGCNLSISGTSIGAGIKFNVIYPGSSIDSSIDLSDNDGVSGYITINAYDKQTQNTSVSRQVFVQKSSYLKPVFAAGDQLFDFNYGKVLVSNPSWGPRTPQTDLNPYVYRSRVVNIVTGDSIALPYQGPLSDGLVFNPSQTRILTAYGAIFSVVDTNTFLTSLYDWHDGSLDSLGSLNSSLSLRVSGDFAIWSNATRLYLRQLQAATDTMISSAAVNWRNDITSAGAVIYGGTDYNIYRFANGGSTPITIGPVNKWNISPVTDGSKIVYTRSDPCCTNQHYSLRLYDGRSDTLLSDMGTIEPSPMSHYQLNNGYIAYTKPDSAAHLQVWLADTSGSLSQITTFAGNSTLDVLNPKGDLTLIRTTGPSTRRRFFVNRTSGQITDLGTADGQVYYRDPDWYLALGRMLYKIDPALYPYKPAVPRISGLNSNYCSNQGVQKIKVLNLPDAAISVKATLDNASLSVAPDSSISFNVTELDVGSHAIEITYSNAIGTQTLTDSFTVIGAVVPVVKLSSNISTVTSLLDPVIITATNVAGGGSNPLYTFAGDRDFIAILQPEGAGDELRINPGKLIVGVNPVYVRMRTSDSCYSRSTAFDSLQVVRNAAAGIIDPDFPNQPISGHPNPFGQTITITGLQSDKSYRIYIRNNLGESLYQYETSNSNTIAIAAGALPGGVYWLSIFDLKKDKLIGTMNIIKK